MSDNTFDKTAKLRCTECEESFTTPSNGDGIRFDGVRSHGSEAHKDERWDYEIEDY